MMTLEDMIILARRSRECAERARQEEQFWERLIAERRRTANDATPPCAAVA
ncbi:hypothetical protein [Sphingomonas sp. BAUL-RG-20F-R05-02]|uniref:hypothetical protein n=1 Tax=Sphingomonas sp. BAUL-RG-20F-R05-02 TaxID=2914830 RepID=UPI001F5ABB83|nr:hypothetical protein [Sphingomonas sp. BAUL-RG-20F-R05-02]